jgi:VanZ family protein
MRSIYRTKWQTGEWLRLLSSPGMAAFVYGAALLCYTLISLWPFAWDPPRHVENGARPSSDGAGLVFPTPGLARTAEPPWWIDAAKRANRIEVSLRVRSFSSSQGGPARILSMSRNTLESSLTVGQRGADLIVSLHALPSRANDTENGGESVVVRVRGAFLTPNWFDIGLAIAPGELRLQVGPERQIRRELAPGPLSYWDPFHRLALGNVVTGSRPWLGEIERAVVRTAGESIDYADATELELPASFWIFGREPKLEPFRHLNPRDAIANVLLYVPLGFLLGTLGRHPRGGRSALAALALVAGVSASMEAAQFFISTRNPSINDVILNTVGGGLGFAVARLVGGWGRGARAWRRLARSITRSR